MSTIDVHTYIQMNRMNNPPLEWIITTKNYASHFMVYANDDNVNIYQNNVRNFKEKVNQKSCAFSLRMCNFIFMSCRCSMVGCVQWFAFVFFYLRFIFSFSIDDLIIYYLKDIRYPISNMLNKMSQENGQWTGSWGEHCAHFAALTSETWDSNVIFSVLLLLLLLLSFFICCWCYKFV